jgi:hypothetical protein
MVRLDNATVACIRSQGSTDDVTLVVSYNATFGPVERHLAAHGLVFEERITVIGEDPGRATDLVLHEFPVETIPVTAGTEPLTVRRQRTMTVGRVSLREDFEPFAHDEIDCRIDVAAIGLPTPLVSVTTPELVLPAPEPFLSAL